MACLVLRQVADNFLQFVCSRMPTNSRNKRKLVHCLNFNIYDTLLHESTPNIPCYLEHLTVGVHVDGYY